MFQNLGAIITIATPFLDEAKAAAKQIINVTRNENIMIEYLDLASFESIQKFSEKIISNYNHIDILINNAGRLLKYNI